MKREEVISKKSKNLKSLEFLVEHTAQHPNSRPVVQTLDLHELGRIGCGSLPLVEVAGIEPASENLSVSASPSADVLLNSLDIRRTSG